MLHVTNYINCDLSLKKYLEELELSLFGEIIYCEKCNRPIQFSPDLRIRNNSPQLDTELIRNRNSVLYDSALDSIGNNILLNVFELTIYYSDYYYDGENNFQYYSNQYLFPNVSNQRRKISDFNFVFLYDYPCLSKINLVVGNLTIDDVNFIRSSFLKKTFDFKIELYIIYDIYMKLKGDWLDIFSTVHLIYYNDIFDLLKDENSGCSKVCFVENDFDLKKVNKAVNSIDVYPVFNRYNGSFVKEYLSFNKMDLLELSIDERNILLNKYLNSNFYGELSIYPSGEVYSRKNASSLGNIKDSDIRLLLLKELVNERNWFLTRQTLPSCKGCIFKCICPPPTYIELEMKCCFCRDNNINESC